MKNVLISLISLGSVSAFAGNLYYSNGPAKGLEVAKRTAYIGYYDICFVGKGTLAKTSLYSLLLSDDEKISVFTSFNTNKDTLVYGYINIKCMDEGESETDCRSVKIAARCL